jgi:hypothetical protein
MQRSFALLFPMLLAAAAPAGCQKKKPKAADPKKEAVAAPAAAALTIEDAQAMLPETLSDLPRQLVAPEPEIPQVSAYYQDGGNTRSGHVRYTMIADPAKTLEYYQGRFPERVQVGGRTVFARVWQPKAAPETAEGCLVVGQAIGVCVDIAPGKIADLAPLFAALPLAELEKRAAAKK